MKFNAMILAATALAASASGSSYAQAPAAAAAAGAVSPAVGDKVFDAQGDDVGTIDSVSGTTAVINTGTNKAAVPFASFAKSDKGLVLGMTKAELDAAASAAGADAKAKFLARLVSGTSVVDAAGATLGTIDANDGTLVTLSRGGAKMKLPVAAFGPTADGTGVQIGMTGAELDAAAKQAGAAAPASSETGSTGSQSKSSDPK
jgi:hypothetical protein